MRRNTVYLIIIVILLLTGLLLPGIAKSDILDSLNVGDLKPGQRVTITFKVTVNSLVYPHIKSVGNQAVISGSNFDSLFTDDPDTLEANDSTEIPLDNPEPIYETMNLSAGWSMISLPVLPYNAILSELFPGAVVLYGFEKDVGYFRVKEEDELEVGRGYWMLLDQNQSYLLTGQPIPSYTLPVDEDGWTMIGGCSYPAQAFSENCDIVVIYGYVQGMGYQRVLDSESIEPGKGYWILFNNVMDQAKLRVE